MTLSRCLEWKDYSSDLFNFYKRDIASGVCIKLKLWRLHMYEAVCIMTISLVRTLELNLLVVRTKYREFCKIIDN